MTACCGDASRWTNQELEDGKNASPCLTQKAPYKGLGAESEEKREPASDIDTGVVDSLKVLDPDGRLEKREPASDIDTGVMDGLKVLDPDGRLEKRL
jgi:hypothetical protein